MSPTAVGRLAGLVPTGWTRRLPVEVRSALRDRFGLAVPGDLAHRPAPPPTGPGEVPGPPDVVVVGGASTGARRWSELLADHPQATPLGDPDVLSDRFERYATEGFGPAEAEAVAACFPRPPGHRTVVWVPDGMVHPWVAPVLVRAAPEVRVVALVGDPVAGVLADLAQTAELRPPHPGTWLSDAVDRGYASEHLARMTSVLPPERLLVLQAERCAADPLGQLARTDAFCGLDPAARTGLAGPAPAPAAEQWPVAPEVLGRLRELFADEVDRLTALVPDVDVGLWTMTRPPGRAS